MKKLRVSKSFSYTKLEAKVVSGGFRQGLYPEFFPQMVPDILGGRGFTPCVKRLIWESVGVTSAALKAGRPRPRKRRSESKRGAPEVRYYRIETRSVAGEGSPAHTPGHGFSSLPLPQWIRHRERAPEGATMGSIREFGFNFDIRNLIENL